MKKHIYFEMFMYLLGTNTYFSASFDDNYYIP